MAEIVKTRVTRKDCPRCGEAKLVTTYTYQRKSNDKKKETQCPQCHYRLRIVVEEIPDSKEQENNDHHERVHTREIAEDLEVGQQSFASHADKAD